MCRRILFLICFICLKYGIVIYAKQKNKKIQIYIIVHIGDMEGFTFNGQLYIIKLAARSGLPVAASVP